MMIGHAWILADFLKNSVVKPHLFGLVGTSFNCNFWERESPVGITFTTGVPLLWDFYMIQYNSTPQQCKFKLFDNINLDVSFPVLEKYKVYFVTTGHPCTLRQLRSSKSIDMSKHWNAFCERTVEIGKHFKLKMCRTLDSWEWILLQISN